MPYEIEIRSPLLPLKIYDRLSSLRFFENNFKTDGPFGPSSIFSLDVRYTLWVAEGAFMFYLKTFEIKDKICQWGSSYDLAFRYIKIMYKNDLTPLVYKNNPMQFPRHISSYSLTFFEKYWFTMLTRDFFREHPCVSLFFSLTARSEYIFYLTDLNSNILTTNNRKCGPCIYYEELSKITNNNKLYFGKDFIVNMKELYPKRRECMLQALEKTSYAKALYEDHLMYETKRKKIDISLKPN